MGKRNRRSKYGLSTNKFDREQEEIEKRAQEKRDSIDKRRKSPYSSEMAKKKREASKVANLICDSFSKTTVIPNALIVDSANKFKTHTGLIVQELARRGYTVESKEA
jgi:hypothetical protein